MAGRSGAPDCNAGVAALTRGMASFSRLVKDFSMRTRIFSAREYVSTEHDLRAGTLSWTVHSIGDKVRCELHMCYL